MLQDLFKPKKKIPIKLYLVLQITFFVLFLGVWLILSYGNFVDELFLPSPTDVINSMITLFTVENYTKDILVSVYRVFVGFSFATIIAIPLGLFMGSFQVVRAFFEPMIGFIRYMPAAGFIPLLILWLGIGDIQKFSIIFIGTFFHLTLLIMTIAMQVKNQYIEISYTLGANKRQVFKDIILPSCWPGVLDNLRITLGWAWTYIVVAEIVAADTGVGSMIMKSSRFLDTSNIFVGILTVGILGMLFDFAFNKLDQLLFPYREREMH